MDMTNVVGYYNCHSWPVQITISKYGINTVLPPGDFLKTASGKLINDPYLEVFANARQLSRKTSEEPVPLVAFVEPKLEVMAQQVNPVRSVSVKPGQPFSKAVQIPQPQPQSQPQPQAQPQSGFQAGSPTTLSKGNVIGM